jgi:hypothetical protein
VGGRAKQWDSEFTRIHIENSDTALGMAKKQERALIRSLSPYLFLVIVLSMTGCTGSMVKIMNVDDYHGIDKSLSKNQVKEGIIEGAELAGWRTKDLGNDEILATYLIRVHVIQIAITYSDSFYVTRYSSSSGMKMFCSQRDRDKTRDLKVSGAEQCPGNRPPMYIHGNYKDWVDSLNVAIQNSLVSM